MRNSNCMAIAPTATISNIIGVSQSIEPIYKNLYVKSNLSGEFTVVNDAWSRSSRRAACGTRTCWRTSSTTTALVQQIDRIPDESRSAT